MVKSVDTRILLSGRFGNQMFQLCAALHLKAKYGTNILLDASKLAPRDIEQIVNLKIVKEEEIYLNCMQSLFLRGNIFGIVYDFIFRGKKFMNYRLNRMTGMSLIEKIGQKHVRFIEDHDWRSLTQFSGPIVGYFQDSNLVEEVWLEMEKRINSSINLKLVKKSIQDDDVLIHVRLGDYLLHPDIGVLEENYYLRALNNFTYEKIFLITDDLVEFEKRFPVLKKKVVYMESSRDPLEALKILCKTKNIVIANSSFSYWGAIFSLMLNKDSKIVAPSPWRADKRVLSPLIDRFILEDANL